MATLSGLFSLLRAFWVSLLNKILSVYSLLSVILILQLSETRPLLYCFLTTKFESTRVQCFSILELYVVRKLNNFSLTFVSHISYSIVVILFTSA